MTTHKRKRILNSKNYLSGYLLDGEQFYVGLLFEDYIKNPNLDRYKLPKNFADGLKREPVASGPITRTNLKGKFVRKKPEEKTTKTVHISYTRKDGTHVAFDRDFNVYVKVLLHQYNASIYFATNKHGQKVVFSDFLTFDESNNMKNTHVINMFCEIFNDFEIFNNELEPAIHFNKKFDHDLLPHGTLDDNVIEELKTFAGRYTRNPDAQRIFQKKLHILQEFNPDVRGKGPNGFYGYIVFGFSDLGIVILETMYPDNATYVFEMKGYEEKIITDKQKALKDKSFIKRFYHGDNWENAIRLYMTKNAKTKD